MTNCKSFFLSKWELFTNQRVQICGRSKSESLLSQFPHTNLKIETAQEKVVRARKLRKEIDLQMKLQRRESAKVDWLFVWHLSQQFLTVGFSLCEQLLCAKFSWNLQRQYVWSTLSSILTNDQPSFPSFSPPLVNPELVWTHPCSACQPSPQTSHSQCTPPCLQQQQQG